MNWKRQSTKVRLRVTNERAVEVPFHLEPWGEVWIMPPGAVVELEVDDVGNDALEITESESSIAFWGTTGSTVKAWRHGAEIDADNGKPANVPRIFSWSQV